MLQTKRKLLLGSPDRFRQQQQHGKKLVCQLIELVQRSAPRSKSSGDDFRQSHPQGRSQGSKKVGRTLPKNSDYKLLRSVDLTN